jgi:hypothetical protein
MIKTYTMKKLVKPRGAPKGARTLESIALTTLKKGQQFFTTKQDKDITAISTHYNKKVRTERLFVLNPISGKTQKVVRVTLV